MPDHFPPPPPPGLTLCVGVTGHRRGHDAYPSDDSELLRLIEEIFCRIDRHSRKDGAEVAVRLNTLLADGTDEEAAHAARRLGWCVCVPLPFGRLLNRAISALPSGLPEIERILAGGHPEDSAICERIKSVEAIEESGCLFEIAERDAALATLLRAHVADPGDAAIARRFAYETGQRYELGGRIIIEQSDMLIAVWDGLSTANVGGTGHTVREALHHAVPVLHIDPAEPERWTILTSTEMLACPASGDIVADREAILRGIVEHALGNHLACGLQDASSEAWHPNSSVRHHPYRRVEALFGRKGLRERFGSVKLRYERPEEIENGSAAPLLAALALADPDSRPMADRIGHNILRPFAWFDGISTHLSDRYRSGMVINFVLGSFAIIAGVLYLPLAGPDHKWVFASVELATLLVIVINTQLGKRRNLHERWFATRRAAEYLRQRPLLVAAGVSRPAGQWPSSDASGWPELYARMAVRSAGLPETTITEEYLRQMLASLLDLQVLPQKRYHAAKSRYLNRVHHALDRGSEWLFGGGIAVVALFLFLTALKALGWLETLNLVGFGKWVTVAGVAFPTVGGALAGIRYFGDFERFADISLVARRRLEDVEKRIRHLSDAAPGRLVFNEVADLLRATDEIVFDELESWQAVFSGKRIAVPV